jgi:hypothetical protein
MQPWIVEFSRGDSINGDIFPELLGDVLPPRAVESATEVEAAPVEDTMQVLVDSIQAHRC